MRLQRIQELVFHRPWLITPSGHAAIRAIVERKLFAEIEALGFEPEAGGISIMDLFTPRPDASIDEEGTAHIHIMGAIGIGFSKLEKACGNTDTRDLEAELRKVQEDGAQRIMLHVDSPGGTVGGVAEAADEIASTKVSTFAYVDGGAMACSAAYWLASSADRIYASSSAEVGSIGVYMPWIDSTAAIEQRGYKIELIKNAEGDLKGAGYPGTALSDAQRADWQEGVQQIFDAFAGHVRANRPGAIDADTLRGQTFFAKDAKKRNLIDGVAPYESALRTLKRYKREG